MIYNVIITVLTATSIFLLILFIRLKNRLKALERELSSGLEHPPENIKDNTEELALLKEKALREIEEQKRIEMERLQQELRLKRVENDEEISKKQQLIDKIVEEYKNSKFESIDQTAETIKIEVLDQIWKEIVETQTFAKQELQNLDQLRRNQLAITDALRRKALEDNAYNIQLNQADRLEVEDLQTIAIKYPRVRQIILKATYDIYYAPEVKKLVSRVVGDGRVSGIYRITCKVDGRLYIGKSVDIRDRWTTHFKRACGVESETTNLLYPAMRKFGIENFSFEIIESGIPEDRLGEREKYWQQFYDAKTHGFSVR